MLRVKEDLDGSVNIPERKVNTYIHNYTFLINIEVSTADTVTLLLSVSAKVIVCYSIRIYHYKSCNEELRYTMSIYL